MCGLSQKGNRMGFVHPRLASMEHEVPGKDYRRVNDFKQSPRAEMGGEATISWCLFHMGIAEGELSEGDTHTSLQSENSRRSLSLGHSVSQDGLPHGSGVVSLVCMSS